MDRQEIIDLLEKARYDVAAIRPIDRIDQINRLIDQALTLLKQPKCKTCGDTGKRMCASCSGAKMVGIPPDIICPKCKGEGKVPCPDCQQPTAGVHTKKAREYCNSVIEFARSVKDTVSEETKDVITEKLFKLLFEGFDIIDRAEAEKKDLLELCEEFMERADDGSAEFDDPVPSSIFLRAEAAIAKASPNSIKRDGTHP